MEELARANMLPLLGWGTDFPNHRQSLKEALHHPDSKRRGLSQDPMYSSTQAHALGTTACGAPCMRCSQVFCRTYFILPKPLICMEVWEKTYPHGSPGLQSRSSALAPQCHALSGAGKPVQQSLASARGSLGQDIYAR